jgi:hypothetical protein
MCSRLFTRVGPMFFPRTPLGIVLAEGDLGAAVRRPGGRRRVHGGLGGGDHDRPNGGAAGCR